jgi:hypothetical protein
MGRLAGVCAVAVLVSLGAVVPASADVGLFVAACKTSAPCSSTVVPLPEPLGSNAAMAFGTVAGVALAGGACPATGAVPPVEVPGLGTLEGCTPTSSGHDSAYPILTFTQPGGREIMVRYWTASGSTCGGGSGVEVADTGGQNVQVWQNGLCGP